MPLFDMPLSERLCRVRDRILPVLNGPPALAFLPAVTLGAFWLGGEPALLVVSLGLPLVFAAIGSFHRSDARKSEPRDSATGLLLRAGHETVVHQIFGQTGETGLRSACFVLEIDEFRELASHHGDEAADTIAMQTGDRIRGALRDGDSVARLSDNRFGVCLKPVHQLDLEICIGLSGRMQSAVEAPVSLDGLPVYLSCSIGFCLSNRAPGPDAADWSGAAAAALAEAQQNGPSSIRAFSADIMRKNKVRRDLHEDAANALEAGQIQPWFQPQISTSTGRVTGFEALARWSHPEHGMIAPQEFLPVMEQAGLVQRLGQIMLYHSLTALKAWDNAGANVPRIGVNFATDELRDPRLVDTISWELDRFDLTPDRLAVEILETVVTDSPDDTVVRNIAGLVELGCSVDLDDFGTGHASIASIRRFSISRIKIDRSFVIKADQDPEQQRLIAAILTMAERLEVETLAEGVETVGEHALLAQLGCDHVQGFGIGRPMPFDQTLDWIARHEAKLADAPLIGRNAG